MNRTYSIQIKHHRTGEWVYNTSITTTTPAEELRQQFERDYNQPVRVVETTQQVVDDHFDVVMHSIVADF